MDIIINMDSVVAWIIVAAITIIALCRFAVKAIEEKSRHQKENEEFFQKFHNS